MSKTERKAMDHFFQPGHEGAKLCLWCGKPLKCHDIEGEYVVSFVFHPVKFEVLLIEKRRPECQVGCLNGIGGHRQQGESFDQAALRELAEEAGLIEVNLVRVGQLQGVNNDGRSFQVFVYAGFGPVSQAVSKTDELISRWSVAELVRHHVFALAGDPTAQKIVGNVPTLVLACLNHLTTAGSTFSLNMDCKG